MCISNMRYMNTYVKELGEEVKSHDLLSASGRLRRTSGVVPVRILRPEDEENHWGEFPSEGRRPVFQLLHSGRE